MRTNYKINIKTFLPVHTIQEGKRGDVTYKPQPLHHVPNGAINKTTISTISNSNSIELNSSFTTSSSELSYQDEWSMLHSLDQGFSSLRFSFSPTDTVSYEELYKNYRYWESIQRCFRSGI